MLWLIFSQVFVFFDTVNADDSHIYSWYDFNETLNVNLENASGLSLTSGKFSLSNLWFGNIFHVKDTFSR